MLSPLEFCLHAEFRPPTGWCCTREYYLDQTFSYTKRDSEIKERSILPILHLIPRLLFKLKKKFLEQRLNLSFIPPRLTSSPHVPVCLIFLHLFTKIIAMKDKYFSKTKMVCRPLWLTATLKARNFPPKTFCGPRKLSYGKTSNTGIPSLMYRGATPARPIILQADTQWRSEHRESESLEVTDFDFNTRLI